MSHFLKSIGPEVALHSGDPAASAETIEEHAVTQAEFLDNTLQPLLAKGRAGNGPVFFVDAAHFVQGAFLSCRVVWLFAEPRAASDIASWELGTR